MSDLTSVLIVDDEPAVRQLMSRWASSMGLEPRTAGTADEALQSLHGEGCDLAVVDVRMPGRDGLWLTSEMRRSHPNTAVVLATAYSEMLDREVENPPVADLMLKPFNRDRFVQAIDRGRAWLAQARNEIAYHDQLLDGVNARVREIRTIVSERYAAGEDEASILLRLLAQERPDVFEHSQRVGIQAEALARALEMDDDIVALVARAALMHDIGKLAVPSPLLSSTAVPSAGEIAAIRRHVEAGAELLDSTVALKELAPLVRASHEWYGGGGYPDNLSGDTIPLGSRLIAVVDAHDAITNDRCYRERQDASFAATELLRCSPRQFDPEVVIPFLVMKSRP